MTNATPLEARGMLSRIVLIASMLLLSAAALAVDSLIPAWSGDDSISAEQLETAINAVSAREGIGEDTRKAVIDQLRDAAVQIQNRTAADAATAAFMAALQSAPEQTRALQRKLDAPSPPPPTVAGLGIGAGMPVEDVESLLSQTLAELASAEARLSELEAQIATLEERPSIARQRINDLRAIRDKLAIQAESAPPPGEPQLLTEARRLNTQLRIAARNAELRRLEQELTSQSVRLALVRVQRDVAARDAARQREEAEVLQRVTNERRQSAVAQVLQDASLAELAAADSHPVIRTLAEGNAELTRELPTVVADTERVTEILGEIEDQARQIQQAFARSMERLEIGGVSQVIGRLFVEERRNLPQVSQYRAEVRERRKTLAQIGLAQVRTKEQRRELTPIAASVESTMAEIDDGTLSDEELQETRAQVERLLRDRRDLLDQVSATYTSYMRALGDLDLAQQSLLDAADDYKVFLDRHLMWIPSASFFGPDSVRNLGPALAWLLSPRSWGDAFVTLLDTLQEDIGFSLTALAALLLAIFLRRPLFAQNKKISSRVGNIYRDNIGLTLGALGIAVLRAAPLPLTLLLLSWALSRGINPSDFTHALSRALGAVAPFLYNALLFRILCADGGVLQVHFDWGAGRLPRIRRQLDRLIAIGVPIIFVAALTYSSPVSGHRESLGRLAFMAVLIVFSGIAHPLLHPVKGAAAKYYSDNPAGWASRFRWIWYVLVAGAPLLLVAITLVGYLYTAAILTRQIIDTFWLVLSIGVASLVIRRWLALARVKLAEQQEREQRKLAAAAAGEGGSEGELPDVARKPLDLDAIDLQTRRLVNAVLVFIGVLFGWGIWSDVLPALGILEQVSLYTRTAVIDGQETVVPVTLADLMLGMVVAAVTMVASKNLPGLMEILFLQRMTLQPGSRYAINTLVRYVVVTVGVIAVLNIIGWDWSQIQWLVAALSVGLGFGLQEIVANFVSGLVILFERPVRVGDTVTVGQLTGKVSRVRIRATTITDWDRKEIIVPNKAFITEQVINWTLSDPITRIVIPVGISYGSDFNLAHRVMEDTLRAMPLVLDEPPPKVYFVGFGDSSLDFNLYVFSRELEDRLPMTHAVHQEILAALREHGIEIPFPQRDLHLRSVSPDIKGVKTDDEEDDKA